MITGCHGYVVLTYAVHMLQEMLNCYETELMWLDMRINAKNSDCIRVGPRYDTDCFEFINRQW